jgi:hypothetical protein
MAGRPVSGFYQFAVLTLYDQAINLSFFLLVDSFLLLNSFFRQVLFQEKFSEQRVGGIPHLEFV